jgi:NAD-dependent dihydropyrimidine dehydrogenase PreA subunit/predicted Fe-Mo cluster-binding NifX family protein
MINISPLKCVGCGLCIKKCPKRAITITENDYAKIDVKKCSECLACAKVCPQDAILIINTALIFALGCEDDENMTAGEHIGSSKYYNIYKYVRGNFKFIEKRENIKYEENENHESGDPEKAEKVASVLKDVNVMVGRMFGPNITKMRKKFVPVVIREKKVNDVLKKLNIAINEIYKEKNKKDEKNAIIIN